MKGLKQILEDNSLILPNGKWSPRVVDPTWKSSPEAPKSLDLSQQEPLAKTNPPKRSGAVSGVFWKEKMGWILVGIVLGMMIFFVGTSIVYGA